MGPVSPSRRHPGDGRAAARRSAGLSDAGVVALAVATWSGARLAVPVPRALALVLVIAALVARRPLALTLGSAALASGLAAAALAGLAGPLPARFEGPVTLLTDPAPTAAGQRVEVRAGGRHLEAWARGGAAGALVDRLGGERVWVSGRVRPSPDGADWRVARHLAGQLEIEAITRWGPGDPASQAANALRRTLVTGATGLDDDTRALFAGFVLGDDRGRSALVTDDFRGSGLSHLLVVSGQNVAFVLALADPMVRRLGLSGRLLATLGILAGFALVTRFEPSVLRASAMAAVAVTATTWGRDASGVRVLALAVSALVLLDPLLVRSLGFQLSVGASLGIALLSRPLATRLPGPGWVVRPVSVSLAAQLGVAPLLLATFGGLPVVAPLANLVAVPAAGPISTWGLTAGVVAGVVPALADTLHLPTRLLVGWVATVARMAVGLPLGQLGPVAFVGVVGFGAAAAMTRGSRRRGTTAASVGLLVALLLMPAVRLRFADPPTRLALGADAVVWRSEGRTLVELGGRVREADLLAGLREAGVADLDLVVCRTPAASLGPVVVDLRRRYGPVTVLAPEGSPVAGAQAPPDGTEVALGSLLATLDTGDGAIAVVVRPTGGGRGGPV